MRRRAWIKEAFQLKSKAFSKSDQGSVCMELKNAMFSVTTDNKKIMKIIADNLIETHPRGEIEYRPYRKNEVCYEPGLWAPTMVNLKKLYPNACKGNVVYVGTILDSVAEYDANLYVIGNVKVIYHGEIIYDHEEQASESGKDICPIHLEEGQNPILFMVRCDCEDDFSFQFMVSVPPFRFWARDYILHVRATSPITCFAGEDGVGVSALYDKELPFDGTYVYPKIEEKSNEIHFERIYPNAAGVCAYAMTTALQQAKLCLKGFSDMKVLVNGKEVLCTEFSVEKGDVILVKALKGTDWGFAFEQKAPIGIPFLKSFREVGDKWLTIGTFGTENSLELPYGPELEIQFTDTYTIENWEASFWKLNTAEDYIRPYMKSCFFSQWFYALMVGHYGLLQVGKVLYNRNYIEYFVDSIQNLTKFHHYMQYEKKEFGFPTFIQKGTGLNDLDSIGTMGMNMCELYKLKPSPEILYCIELLANAAKEKVPRLEDGTYCRPRDMWADDVFMSCPFLVRLGLIKRDKTYFEEVVRQIRGFKKRLWMEDKKVFSHIYFRDSQMKNRIPWGRGNGWVFVTLSDVLEHMPKDMEGREELLELFMEFAKGVAEKQDKDGLWHQVLTRPDSYQETSCTGMFIIGMCRGVRNGWLSQSYKELIKKAFLGLIKYKIDKDGNIYDVCRGSGNSMDENYYMSLGVIENDDHGTGIILMALAEMTQIFEEGDFV